MGSEQPDRMGSGSGVELEEQKHGGEISEQEDNCEINNISAFEADTELVSVMFTTKDLVENQNGEKATNFFEGVEKLLEVWFTVSGGETGESDLRKIPRSSLECLLSIVHCSIVSTVSNSQVDAYVLSESSMFISKRRFILKTCGTTTPLDCIEELTRLVKEFSGFDTVEEIFYSRKNFQRPELQRHPHKHFEQEVKTLEKYFGAGAAYCMGSLNKDCWYMYTMKDFSRKMTSEPDQTIEILMSELDPDKMQIFHRENSSTAQEAREKSGIADLVHNMKIDDYLFQPCGYSLNGVLLNESEDYGLGEYVTIHITPEQQFSYVSFESNVPASSYLSIVTNVLKTFNPGRFILTIFATKTSVAAPSHQELKISTRFDHWVRNDIQCASFQDCDLTYAHFARTPS